MGEVYPGLYRFINDYIFHIQGEGPYSGVPPDFFCTLIKERYIHVNSRFARFFYLHSNQFDGNLTYKLWALIIIEVLSTAIIAEPVIIVSTILPDTSTLPFILLVHIILPYTSSVPFIQKVLIGV